MREGAWWSGAALCDPESLYPCGPPFPRLQSQEGGLQTLPDIDPHCWGGACGQELTAADASRGHLTF